MNLRPLIVYSLTVIVGMLVVGAWAWTQLPPGAEVPVHWGLEGVADVFMDKTLGLFFVPVLTAGLVGVLAAIPRIEPRRANLERSGKAYGATWVAVVTLFGLLQALVVAAALGVSFDMTRIMLVAVGLLFMVVGNYLPKVRPNYLMGIRTPWTITSDLSWVKTHRIGGRLFVIEGLGLAILGIAGVTPMTFVGLIVGGLLVVLAIVFAYSYRVWKLDPQRRTT